MISTAPDELAAPTSLEEDDNTPVRLALVLVWSGPWQPWINLHVETCRHNPAVQFLFFTDQPPPAARAPNVHFIPFTRADLAARIRARLRIEPWLGQAYKLCDYKPFLGLLFAPELAAFTHWGYCDEDVFWGDLTKFLTPRWLHAHDIVTSTRCCLAGQLTIFKNEPGPTGLPLRVPGWRELLLQPNSTNFSETIINTQALREEAAGDLTVSRRQIQVHDEHDEDWNRWANELERAATGRTLGVLAFGATHWREGKIRHSFTGQPFAFFHFKTWKKRWALSLIPPPPRGIAGWGCSAAGLHFYLDPATAGPRAWLFLARHAAGVRVARVRRRLRELRRRWQLHRADTVRARRLATSCPPS